MLLAEGVRGKTVAIQLHGYTDVRQLERLRMSGATVLTVTPYRWVKPDGADRLPRLIEAACSGNLDVLTFTSAPAVDAMWSTAHEMGLYKQLVESLKTTVTTAVVGPVTAQPLLDAGITPLVPERFRMGALIRLVCEHLALNHVRRLKPAPAWWNCAAARCGSTASRWKSPPRRCCCCARSSVPGAPCSPGSRCRNSSSCADPCTPWT